ncbi:unnamed protein product [Staurois parvus]|uniref:Uncharacterized protein n=1 Tax=Staurois parvus TaxID=386267 RepID=A0ABN9AG59_9NEOB|nr:unnamed protein product [Staurois parvus]
MHSSKKKKTTSLVIHIKLSMCRVTPHDMSYQVIRFHSEYNKHALLHIQTNFTL